MGLRVTRREDRLNPERTDADVTKILALIVEIRPVWQDVAEGGGYQIRVESNGRKKGFDDLDPTYTAVVNPSQRQLRRTGRRAASRIADAREALEDAALILHNGLLRTDPEVMAEFLEKRAAAIGE